MANIGEKNSLILQRMLSSEFYISPLKFCLWAYPWGTGDLKSFKGPRKWQREVMLEMEEYLRDALTQKKLFDRFPDFFREAIASGRGPGKSAFLGMLAHWFMSTRIGGSVWVAANGEPQLRTKTFPEIAKWVMRGINSEFFEVTSTAVLPSKWFKEYIESPEGLGKNTRYYYIAGQLWSQENPDAFAGAHNFDGEMALFDESSGIPDAIWTVQEGVFTEDIADRFWLAFSNPRRNEGAFFECFHKNKKLWRTRQIDSRTVEGISTVPFDNIIEKYGEDSDEARIEVYGQFPSVGDNQFIPPKLVDEALSRQHGPESGAKTVLGVDVARFGNDRTVFAIRKGRSLLKLSKYQGLDTMEVTGKVIEMIQVWKPDLTIIDEGGLGAGVLDRLSEQGYKVRGVQFGSRADNPAAYFNKRSEMWGRMRDWLQTASIGSLESNKERDNKELKADLSAPRYKISSNGALQLESKQDMKKRGLASTDCGDAIALTLAYPVGDSILLSDRFRLWSSDIEIPSMSFVVQSYAGAYTEKMSGKNSACTVWGVFDWKGQRCVMLLDSWSEKMTYPTMREKVIAEWHSSYGGSKNNVMIKSRKADVALVGASAGDALIGDLRNANIIIPKYATGDNDLIERAHQSAPIMDTGCIFIPESKKRVKRPVSWANDLFDQCDQFPNDEATELVDTFTRAMLYIRDSGYLEMPVADPDEEEWSYNYSSKRQEYANPYAM